MTEVFFYHLQRQPVDKVLPQLLEKCLERGWRCVVQAGSAERVDALDQLLWTYDDASFLPHGTERDPEAARQPVIITDGPGNPNAAVVRFLLGEPAPDDAASYTRLIHLFDGTDPDQVEGARGAWRAARQAGHTVAYWQQDEGGRWVQKA